MTDSLNCQDIIGHDIDVFYVEYRGFVTIIVKPTL